MKNEEKISFEENLSNLEKIVKDLESGSIPLDNAIEKFNDAMKIASECNKTLEEATETINKVLSSNGEENNFKIEE